MNNELTVESLFPLCVCHINKPEFLENSKIVFDRFCKNKQQYEENSQQQVFMTQDMSNDETIRELSEYILNTSWNILDYQGYNLQDHYTQFLEFWGQEHKTGSSMDYHVHGHGAQISGFYFIEVPEEVGNLVFHDPKISKVYGSLQEKDYSLVTYATNSVTFKPKVGDMYFHNSWLPHSFTKNNDKKAFKFLHFNIRTIHKDLLNFNLPNQKKPIVI